MKLSIITPYYKTLDYTKELARVLEPQLNSETEWIIVDDGCNEKELDSIKAKVIHLEVPSGNASKPRNVGLDNAKGKYIAFIDSDDMVAPNYISRILEEIEKGFDYCYISWKWRNGEVIIDEEAPKWNTCVWNCVYNKSLIRNRRFDCNKNIGEDEEFNKVRGGKRRNITDILYYYNWNRPDSLTTRFSNGEIMREKIKCGLLVYQKAISKIGGIETFIFEFMKALYKDYDITFVYKDTDPDQLRRYKKYVRCIKFNNQFFECDKYICASNQDNIADNVNSLSGEYFDMIHADLDAMEWTYYSHPKTTKHIAVSELAKRGIEMQDNRPCIVIYNLLELVENKKPIMIMSAQRFSEEKGEKEMKMFSRRCKERGIPVVWVCFTDNKVGEEDNILFHQSVLDIQNYFGGFDYFASFSKTESYGYSLVQAMSYGLPLIVRDIPILDELGFKDGVHGYKLDYDLSNMDEIIDKLYKIPKCKYEKLDNKQDWINALGKINKYNDYEREMEMKYLVEALDTYEINDISDSELGRIPKAGETWIVSKERLDVLLGENSSGIKYVRVLEEIKEDEVLEAHVNDDKDVEVGVEVVEEKKATKPKKTTKKK